MAELTSEDSFRLNVLLAAKPLAIRIHEPSMTVFGLSDQGEAQIELHPNARDEAYLRAVRELLSSHVLGSPGGYPVYLQRWTRMGQMRDSSLDQLLLLGEPEAVVAVVCAQGLTDELARRAWWACEDAENARRMLERKAVVAGAMGSVLAQYLNEHLAFETEPEAQVRTVRLILQDGLLDDDTRSDLWRKAQQKRVYQLGFLAARPDAMPHADDARDDFAALRDALLPAHAENPVAQALLRVAGESGQAWIRTAEHILAKPSNQDVVNILLEVIADYFAALRPDGAPDATLDDLEREADGLIAGNGACSPSAESWNAVAGALPDQRPSLIAMRVLSGLSYGVVRPVFSKTTAIGTVMRKRLAPIVERIDGHLQQLGA
ncbi:MAG: sulfur reduction protein DsrS [Chromatiales bacterium]|nr:sulfur reduction protein DsrS [Chromatiales bacterium]